VLDTNYPFIETLIIALTDLGRVPLHVHLRGGTRPMRTYLSQTTGITLHDRVEGALQHLGAATYVLHHGTPLVAEAALSCGRPQLILPFIHEQGIMASFLERNGAGQSMTNAMSAPDLADYLVRQFRNLAIVQQAQLAARDLAAIEFPDTMAAIVQASERLAQGKRAADEFL
jgi:UDP:flavonoid glycosyltransferase YjiC (YdhE family)